ncbi:MAG: hypothetical protein L6V88_07965 [Anaerotruncus sp.]|nr:MAG: hypothetical protein L6V88_07965 [Anaerotruncus sp.]
MVFFGVPLTLGVIGVAKTLVPVFFGDGWEPVINMLLCYEPFIHNNGP